jgi:glutathione S-transferase
VPFETVPVKIELDKGYYFCPYTPLTKIPVIDTESFSRLKEKDEQKFI